MAITNLFSKRQKKLRGEVPDVYQYENIPDQLKVQIIHIIRDALGKNKPYGHKDLVPEVYKIIHKTLCREYGVFELKENCNDDERAVIDYFLQCKDYEKVLDIVELFFCFIDINVRTPQYQSRAYLKSKPDEAIDKLNARFKEHVVGYQFESGQLIKIDSQFLHSDAVIPTLTILGKEKRFEGANEEFLKAHEHYRHGRYKECLVDALKAFESVMKAICEKQKWPYKQNDTAKRLIDICLKNGLVPQYLQTQLSNMQNLFESGVPTIRNKLGGHGQGTTSTKVDDSVASYALHLAASNIVFFAQLERENFS